MDKLVLQPRNYNTILNKILEYSFQHELSLTQRRANSERIEHQKLKNTLTDCATSTHDFELESIQRVLQDLMFETNNKMKHFKISIQEKDNIFEECISKNSLTSTTTLESSNAAAYTSLHLDVLNHLQRLSSPKATLDSDFQQRLVRTLDETMQALDQLTKLQNANKSLKKQINGYTTKIQQLEFQLNTQKEYVKTMISRHQQQPQQSQSSLQQQPYKGVSTTTLSTVGTSKLTRMNSKESIGSLQYLDYSGCKSLGSSVVTGYTYS